MRAESASSKAAKQTFAFKYMPTPNPDQAREALTVTVVVDAMVGPPWKKTLHSCRDTIVPPREGSQNHISSFSGVREGWGKGAPYLEPKLTTLVLPYPQDKMEKAVLFYYLSLLLGTRLECVAGQGCKCQLSACCWCPFSIHGGESHQFLRELAALRCAALTPEAKPTPHSAHHVHVHTHTYNTVGQSPIKGYVCIPLSGAAGADDAVTLNHGLSILSLILVLVFGLSTPPPSLPPPVQRCSKIRSGPQQTTPNASP